MPCLYNHHNHHHHHYHPPLDNNGFKTRVKTHCHQLWVRINRPFRNMPIGWVLNFNGNRDITTILSGTMNRFNGFRITSETIHRNGRTTNFSMTYRRDKACLVFCRNNNKTKNNVRYNHKNKLTIAAIYWLAN